MEKGDSAPESRNFHETQGAESEEDRCEPEQERSE